MNQWLQLTEKRRLEILNLASNRTGLPAQAIEKDWWVTIVLHAIFSSEYAPYLIFKGGTSLSKAYNLIQRFSEDIDLAIDRDFLNFKGELSKSQIKKLRKASGQFIVGPFRNALDQRLQEMQIPKELYTLKTDEHVDDTSDPHTIELEYNTIVEQGDYLPQRVLIEIGARSLTEPAENKTIQSILDETFPEQPFTEQVFDVTVVVPTKTFLEKVFLLHEEFSKPFDKIRFVRLSRHLYDLEKLMDHEFGIEALNDIELFATIVAHRSTYNIVRGISYERHTHQLLNFIPPNEVIELWRQDYQEMRENMFYGETLEFDQIILRLRELNKRFNDK
ncbi:nucleotidyl transferase AbiEii/AbiGii toxin family protein [Flavobacterium zepuense]|uniref:Nucleotidyl transferase AbiEii/AbiGii toxin family protein n=2 Tax=Flavobacterium zepuense TaxID=2593302 RepID=A0A552V670_9FLAO|nr:nucleotidyl transferase AbiEii/AbiGii toxin family protein [Flavobacterium zepuense]